MPISYEKFFKLLEKKGIKKTHLRQKGIHAVVMDKLTKNMNVDVSTISKLCELLDCQPSDIMEYIPNKKAED